MTTERRDQILAAARDLFLESGLQGLSMRKVGQKVGISATAIYRHFRNKDELLAAVVEEGFRLFGSHLFRALEGRTPQERLILTGEHYLRFAFEQPKYYQVLFMSWDVLRVDSHTTEKHEGLPPTFQFLVDRVRELVGTATDAQAFEMALMLWSQVHGLASLYLAGGAAQAMPLAHYRGLCTAVVHRVVERALG